MQRKAERWQGAGRDMFGILSCVPAAVPLSARHECIFNSDHAVIFRQPKLCLGNSAGIERNTVVN